MALVPPRIPVFIVPPPGSDLRLDQIKQQMEALEHSISDLIKRKKPVPQGLKDSHAFLRAQHDNLELWQNSIAPPPFPGGITFVNSSGQAIYRVELPSGTPVQERPPPVAEPISLECKEILEPSFLECRETSLERPETSPECHETSPESPECHDRVGPHFPEIRACKIRVPAPPTRVGKPNVTVSLMAPSTKKARKPKSPVVQQAAIAERRSLRKAPIPRNIPREINGNLVVNEPNGAVRINGNLYVSEAFRWWTDPNGNEHFVYMPVSVWNNKRNAWSMRVLFDTHGTYTTVFGLPSNPCFERVGNLQALAESKLARMWYVEVRAARELVSPFLLLFSHIPAGWL
jgi:hypothetical protein